MHTSLCSIVQWSLFCGMWCNGKHLYEVTAEQPGGGFSTFTTHTPTSTTVISFTAGRGSKREETEYLHVYTSLHTFIHYM